MTIEILKQNDRLLTVNGKEVRKDMNENWVQTEVGALSPEEVKCCGEFIGTMALSHKVQKGTYTMQAHRLIKRDYKPAELINLLTH